MFAKSTCSLAANAARSFALSAPASRGATIRSLPRTFCRPLSTYYAESHEYVKVEGDIGTVGITAHAADALGDIVFVDLPDVGSEFEQTDSFGTVESVKAASDVYSPIDGEVVEVNEVLEDEPETVNDSPMEHGWFMKIKMSDSSQLEGLMDDAAYEKFCVEEDH